MDFTEKTKKKFKILFMGNASLLVLSIITISWCCFKVYGVLYIFENDFMVDINSIKIINSKIFTLLGTITAISIISAALPPYLLFRTNKKDKTSLSDRDNNRLSIKLHQKYSGIIYTIITFIYAFIAFKYLTYTDKIKACSDGMERAEHIAFISHLYHFLSIHFVTLFLIFMFYTSIFIMTYQIKKKLIIFIRHNKGLAPSRD